MFQELLQLWDSEQYRENSFDWIDNFVVMRDQDKIESLDLELQKRITDGDTDDLYLTVPEVIEWANPMFRYQKPRQGRPHLDISWETYVESVFEDGNEVTIGLMKRQSVHCFIGDDDAPTYSWLVYRCLSLELHGPSETYLLSNGVWYKVDQNYISTINQDVMTIPECTFPLARESEPDKKPTSGIMWVLAKPIASNSIRS